MTTYALDPFASIPLDEELLELLIAEHESIALPRLRRLWCYYRNALAEPTDAGGSSGAPAQKAGLPRRLVEIKQLHRDDRFQREIVIENDIAWRIHTLVDFMFPAPPRIASRAANIEKRRDIDAILNAVFDANGGISLWQNAALLGAVYGHVDFLINVQSPRLESPKDQSPNVQRASNSGGETSGGGGNLDFGRLDFGLSSRSPGAAPSKPSSHELSALQRAATHVLIETIEAPRAIPLLNRDDYRDIDAYILFYRQFVNAVEREGVLARLGRALKSPTHRNAWASQQQRASITVIEIHSASHMQRYEDGELVMERVNRLGRVPVVHVQNLSQPLYYEGLSDVEPLIPLQDELNTRLSDRANRVTMQSFRMWLGKGIEGFTDRPVGPGQMWLTDNMEASIEAFGGDADSPSEKSHIEELREALDKASGVTPAAAGHIKARVGNLTSENALRISLMGTIAKIKRKRVTYGAGIQSLCEMILHALDVYGIYRTTPDQRQVEVNWTDPLPADESRRIADALAKAKLGVPLEALRAELGYADITKMQAAPGAR